jgi:hypothetical protein
MSGQGSRVSGYAVNAKAAVDLLEHHNQDAAAWWRTHAPHMLKGGRHFLFDEPACRKDV